LGADLHAKRQAVQQDGTLNLKTAVSPRKTRKTQKKSVCCICAAIRLLGDDIQFGISLNFFVLFVFFVDQMIF